MILQGMEWLGLAPDEAPVFQSTRAARHVEVAQAMLASGHAYRCYCTAEELREMRDRAKAEHRTPRYDGYWRDREPSEAPAGAPFTVRLRAPTEGETVVHDLVQGEVRVANAELDDMIVLRSDGSPTYLHAVVCDDHDMAITHVIRGDDHLTNTFRQVQVYEAMGWERPAFAHIPLIHGADGTKLSKRHGAVSVLEFREQGYLPEALCNYLLRLGWGHGDAEVLSREEAVALFDIDAVGRAASRMDYAKLGHLNGVYMRAADDDRLVADVLKRLRARAEAAGEPVSPELAMRLSMLMPGLKERARTMAELADAAVFLARSRPIEPEPKALALLTPAARALLGEVAVALGASDFTAEGVDAALRGFAERAGVKLGQVAQPIRAALTGMTTSPGIDATLAALGREESLARIADAAKG